MFSAPIRSVHPAGGSATQRTARVNTRNQGYRQQIIATRQIQQRQQPRVLANPRQDAFQVQERQRRQQQANVRAQHIAIQQVHMVQDQVPNPRRANNVLAGQTYQKLREVADIGRLSKLAQNTQAPLQHRVGALRSLRSRYGIPVTQDSFKAFRQAQAFHSFLHDGKEGDTFALPTNQKGPGLHRVSQTYQLRKVKGDLVPLAVGKRPIFSLAGALSGHPYRDQLVPQVTAHEAIAGQSGGIARGFTHMGIDTAHYGAKAIPEGKVGTPLRKGITEIAALGPNTITGLYGLGSAGVAAATGNTKPIRQIAKSFSEDDPIGRLVTHGDFKAVAAHPGIALVELAGGLTAIDRAAGRMARGGEAPPIRSQRTVPNAPGLARQDRYSRGYLLSRHQTGRDAKTDAKFADLRKQAEAEMAKAEAAKGEKVTIHGQRTVQRPSRAEQVFDPQATRKSITRQERRAVDRPFIREHEVADFKKGAKYSGVLYHVTTPEAAKVVEKAGLDPAKAQRGTYGLGVYSASVPENIPGATHSVKVAVRMRNPLIIESDKAMTALQSFREAAIKSLQKRGQLGERIEPEDLRVVSAEMTRGLQRKGYDGVVVKGAMRGGDYVVNFHPQDVRVVSERTAARRGGRTSAVLERNLPAETRTVAGREVRIPTREEVRVGGDREAVSVHQKKAADLAKQAERHNRNRVREGFDPGSRRQIRGDLERIADVHEGTDQFSQRQARSQPVIELAGKRAVREKNRKPGIISKDDAVAEVQGLVSEFRVAAHRGELTKLADRLESQAHHLTDHHEIATNRSIVGSIREVLRTHNDAQLAQLAGESRRYAEVNVRAHDQAKEHGLGTAEEFDMSSAKPFAVEQMGARPSAEGKLVVIQKAPRDFSHWENRIRTAEDDLRRAKQNGLGGLATKETRLREARAALEAEKGKGRTVDVEHVLTLGEIRTAMQDYARRFPGRTVEPGRQAFISHSSRLKGGGVFNLRADRAQGLGRARRTGAAVVYGTASVGRDAMLASVVKLHVLSNQVRQFRNMLNESAGRDHVGAPIMEPTAEKALKAWNDAGTDSKTGLPKPGFVEGQAVRMNPLGGREEQMAATLHHLDEEGFNEANKQAVSEAIDAALRGEDVGTGPWTVIPKPLAEARLDHSKVTSGSSPTLRGISSAFRHTVLPFSPTWLTGNVIEGGVRGAVAGWRPGDAELEARAIAEWAQMDRVRGERAALAIGRGHLGSVDIWAIHNTANSIKGPLKPIYALGEKIVSAGKAGEVVQWGADAVRAYTSWVLNDVNGTIEAAIKRGMIGTQMRKLMLPKGLAKTSEEAVRLVANELHSNPAALEELVSGVQRAYGAYEHFSPETRRIIINYTPFGAWVINAVNFLFRVLPADHPGLLVLMGMNDSATRQFRRDNGLDATLAGEKDSGQRPPFMMGSIPTPAWYARLLGVDKGSPIRVARYTPFGLMTDATSTLGSMFMPQLPLEVLQGYDFAGRPLRNKDGTPYDDSQLVKQFGIQFAMGTIPMFGQGVRMIQKGPAAVVDPFYPITSKPTSSSKSSGWLPSGSAGSGSAWMPSSGGSSGNAWMP